MDPLFKHFPTFELDDVIIREIRPEEDAQEFFKYITHAEVSAFISNTELPSSINAAKIELAYWKGLFDSQRSFFWAIESKKTKKIIGTLGFSHYIPEHKRAEVSYDLSYDDWGKGIMSKSLKVVLEFAWKNMHVKRIQATVADDNYRSMKLLENCGFMKEGLLHDYGCLHGIMKDYYMYAKLLHEFEGLER